MAWKEDEGVRKKLERLTGGNQFLVRTSDSSSASIAMVRCVGGVTKGN